MYLMMSMPMRGRRLMPITADIAINHIAAVINKTKVQNTVGTVPKSASKTLTLTNLEL